MEQEHPNNFANRPHSDADCNGYSFQHGNSYRDEFSYQNVNRDEYSRKHVNSDNQLYRHFN